MNEFSMLIFKFSTQLFFIFFGILIFCLKLLDQKPRYQKIFFFFSFWVLVLSFKYFTGNDVDFFNFTSMHFTVFGTIFLLIHQYGFEKAWSAHMYLFFGSTPRFSKDESVTIAKSALSISILLGLSAFLITAGFVLKNLLNSQSS